VIVDGRGVLHCEELQRAGFRCFTLAGPHPTREASPARGSQGLKATETLA
jgi:hypothetical protein